MRNESGDCDEEKKSSVYNKKTRLNPDGVFLRAATT